MITHFSISCYGYGLYSLNILYVAFSISHTLLTVDVFFVSFYALVLQDKLSYHVVSLSGLRQATSIFARMQIFVSYFSENE